MDEPENEENSVISVASEQSRSSRGSRVLLEKPNGIQEVTSIPLLKSSRGDREELIEGHLDSILKELDAVRHERNQALELNVHVFYVGS